ncbi:MAG: SDR family NAD(P)-dependent oxidoreductase [Proteobacteria bacterium]|nr:SDR family NAD(P)-dependent oxidoreductase [Pseudomonadota bacterium]
MDGKPLALVTGASAGIGAAFARALAARGEDVALVARRLDRLDALAAELTAQYRVEAIPIQADLSIVDAHAPVMQALEARGRSIGTLVNNAGYSIPQSYDKTTWPQQRDFVMTLVMAVCGLTHAAIPGMIARGRGRIINVSSMTALSPGGAGHTLYPAAKAFVYKFSLSLDAELRERGVSVTCLIPGFTESEFAHANKTDTIMAQSPRSFVMRAEDVVAAALRANDRGQVISIPGMHNRIAAGLMKYLPDSVTTPLIRSAAEKYRIKD